MTSDRTTSPGSLVLDEAAARRILVVRACEAEPIPAALWSAEDCAWASRLANETAGPNALPERWLDERARHACMRLLPRDRALAKWVDGRAWRSGIALMLTIMALALGLLADTLGSPQHVNLLAPPLLAVLAWNLGAYLVFGANLMRPARAPRLQRALGRLMQRGAGPLPSAAADWVALSTPLTLARAALLLHLAAAALAAGLVLGLYLRGLVLDYRAGWQSTFLDAGTVHALLAALLAPAQALTGVALPDAASLATLRVEPGRPAVASAAPWIHWYAVTLGLFVIAPRLALAAVAAVQAWLRSRRIELPLSDPYFQRLLAQARRAQARVQVLPHGRAPSPQAALGLGALVAAVFGDTADLRIASAVRYGDEDTVPPPEAGTTQRLALFDLAATPESEAQGQFVEHLRHQNTPLLLLADESAWHERFATMPRRVQERREAWQRFADEHRLALAVVDLVSADPAPSVAAFEAALAAQR